MNKNLHKAKESKNDEFYTQLSDIQAELSHYTDKFQGKVVFCNCDDPFESNFVKFFLMNFNRLGIKELIASGYKLNLVGDSEIEEPLITYALRVKDTKKYLVGTQKDLDIRGAKCFLEAEKENIMIPLIGNSALDESGQQIQISVKEEVLDENGNPVLDKNGKQKTKTVKQDLYYEAGDFRSDMSLALLNEADIIVTNPPFSLFREYVALLVKYDKQFLIIGNQNAITYKEIFPLLKQNKIWLGYGFNGNVGFFKSPYEDTASSSQHQKGKIRISGVMWFTNIDHFKRHTMIPLDLGFRYYGYEQNYPTYDNYDAINIDKTSEIPCDYKGIMGVPITFLDSFCPEQFELVGLSSKDNCGEVPRFHDNAYYNGYTRGKVVTRMESNMPLLNVSDKGGTLCKKDNNPNLYQLYWRVFIKFTDDYINAHPEQFKKDDYN